MWVPMFLGLQGRLLAMLSSIELYNIYIMHIIFLYIYMYIHAGYAVKEGKKHAGPQPQKWVHVAAQGKGTFQKGQGCQCCSAANMTATSNAKTCVPPAAVYRTLGATPGTTRYQS